MLNRAFRVRAVLFDFDGTLTRPGTIDFSEIRSAVGCPREQPILEFIENLQDRQLREKYLAILIEHEVRAAAESLPNEGAEELLADLRAKKVAIGIISRNSFASIERALQNFDHITESDFDLIISRDDPVAPKPSAEGVFMAAEKLQVDVSEMVLVGDFIFDIQSGRRAGTITVFLSNGKAPDFTVPECDATISSLTQLKDIVRLGLPLPAGKLPNDLLGQFIGRFGPSDDSMIIHPGVGEDVAAMNVCDEEVLVLKTDPITFATDSIGHYAVLINANDIATSGARPRWFLSSLLFPNGTTASEVGQVMLELQTVCERWGITLCGGHTEITDAVSRTVITGMLSGTVAKDRLIDKRNMAPGDVVLMTKAVSVEGTAIIAREFGGRLRSLGVDEKDIIAGKSFLSQISVLPEAEIAGSIEGTSAMHDVTEGGLATALMEFSIAGRHAIKVGMDQIPVFPLTRNFCRLFEIDPLGLIGSGSLLIACRKKSAPELIRRIYNAGIQITYIGEVLDQGEGVEAWYEGQRQAWPRFEVDEIARLYPS